MSQEIIFTTLPHKQVEIEGKKFLKLSVYTSIKLQTPSDTKLATFENILNWAEKIKASDYKFKLANGTLLDATLDREQIDVDLYKNIFHKNIKVDDFKEEDFSKKKFFSVPMVHIQNFVLNNYKTAAIKSPKTLLSADKFIDKKGFAQISRVQLDEKKIERIETETPNKPRLKPVLAKEFLSKKKDTETAITKDLQKNKFVRFNLKMRPTKDFVQLRQFHRVDRQFSKRPTFRIKKPVFEFHDVMAVVNSYPQIMRKLGLILDFVIPYNSSIATSGTIKLVPDALDIDETQAVVSIPATAYNISAKGFYVSDKPNTIFKQGFVTINTDKFSVIQVDADGVALKTVNMAEAKTQQVAKFYEARSVVAVDKRIKVQKELKLKNVRKVGIADQIQKKDTIQKVHFVEAPEEEGLPFMRTAGIAITKNGMAEYIHNSINLNKTLVAKFKSATVKNIAVKKDFKIVPTPIMTQLRIKEPEVILYSDEIVQGYRMDIAYKEDPSKWYSLHHKKDSYTWYDESNNPHSIENIKPDEGFIQLGVAQDPDDEDEVFVSETLARWEGWSLSVHKPGFAINESDDYELKPGETQKKDFVHQSKTLENKKYTFDPDLEFRVNATSEMVKGTLPKLRFGKDYNARIRTVDLAGNSVPLDFQSESPTLTSRKNIRYLRYEPLASPIVLVGNELKDGESLERMVIRSNFDQTTNEYEDSHETDGQFFDEYSQRYLLPPKNSQLIAETHGMFEKAFTNNPAAAQEIYTIIANHEGLYQQAEKNKERVYQPSEVEIIYLPDPMAAGVSLFVAEGYKNTHTQDFKAKMFGFFSNTEVRPNNTNAEIIPNDWYNAGAIRIRLEEGVPHTKWDAQKRTFTLYLPKGHRTRIKFSTFWRKEDLDQLSALWDIVQSESPTNATKLNELAQKGQHWMVSPAREMELVHAVQQPVDQPKILALLPDREYNETTVELNTRFDIHGESTEKVEFQARWIDLIDDGISVHIKEKAGTNSIPNIPILYHDDKITKGTIPEPKNVVKPNAKNLELKPMHRITKRTDVAFKKNPQPGAKRINNLYKPQLVLLNKYNKEKSVKQISLVKRLQLDLLEPKLSFINDINFRIKPLDQHFGDTKHRWVDYRLIGSSRYREYFDKILAADKSLQSFRASDWIEKVNILSTAQPKPPEIDYIIPTFEWKKSKNNTIITHHRLGGGLRIFIKRPWYSSGVDEKLAVVIPADTSTDSFHIMGRGTVGGGGYGERFTNWGIDPILFSTKPERAFPIASDFRFNPEVDKGVQYPNEGKISKATAVAYPVHFDEDRQLWYCDIAISPKEMYFPFVKLVLARYQKHSVRKDDTDVCLSSTVTSDMIQLMPERKSTLRFTDANQKSKLKLTIQGNVYNERNSAVFGNRSFIRISFLEQCNSEPITGIIDPEKSRSILDKELVDIPISTRYVQNNRYTISKDFSLPSKYNHTAFKVLIEEYERGPNKMNIAEKYQDRLEQSEETDRLIYADVFVVNG